MKYPDGFTPKEWSDLHAAPVDPVTPVQQQFKSEVDINTILRRFNVTGSAPLGMAEPMYGDFTGIEDWEDAVEKVEKARADFMRLPAELREKFGNNPGGLIEYANTHTFDEYLAECEKIEAKRKVLVDEKAARIAVASSGAEGAASPRPEAPGSVS